MNFIKKLSFRIKLLAVTAAIIGVGVALALIIPMVSSYGRQQDLNERAKKIFVAAQSALDDYRDKSGLESLLSTMELYGKKLDPDVAGGKVGVYSISASKSGEIIMKGSAIQNIQVVDSVFTKLVMPYLYDIDIAEDASITIEFSPASGIVSSVFYSTEADAMGYGEENLADITERDSKSLQQKSIGACFAENFETGVLSLSSVKLVNKSSLALQLELSSGNTRAMAAALMCKVEILDSQGGAMASFTLPPVQSLYAGGGVRRSLDELKHSVDVQMKDGTVKNTDITAFANNGGSITVILDGMDFAAKQESTVEELLSTMSIRRMELEKQSESFAADNRLSVRLQAFTRSGSVSTVQKSGSANAYFGEASNTLGIENARHLSNIRYKPEGSFTVKQGFSFKDMFSGENGSAVFVGGVQQSEVIPFLPIPALFGDLKGEKDAVISDLVLEGTEDNLGLFRVNEGEISSLTLENTEVKGGNNTGSFCGVNKGDLKNLKTVGGAVIGISDVGGIFGKWEGNEISLSGLSNGADVSGNTYVGGITGRLEAKGAADIIEDCSNTGLILAVKAGDTAPGYLGGIAGYVDGGGTMVLSGCQSAPSADIKEIEAKLKNETLLGTYSGGIAGYIKNAELRDCKIDEGFVVGDRFVGGVVGYYENTQVTLKDITSKVNVIGNTYVGGITGTNAKSLGLDENGFIIPEEKGAMGSDIVDCSTEGYFVAVKEYGGGITGLNGGAVENCGFTGQRNTEMEALATEYNGNYIGGLAGRNNGRIQANSEKKVIDYVAGKNFVGGLTGYNTGSLKLSGYMCLGGTVVGSSFVGGIAGANTAASLFAEGEITAGPSLVKGDYFVGGIIGMSISSPKAGETVNAAFKLQSEEGSVIGKVFTGGFVGYAALMGTDESAGNLIQSIYSSLESSYYSSKKIYDVMNDTPIRERMKPVEGTKLVITGQVMLDTIKSDLCVGGAVGMADPATSLAIKGVTSNARVTAESSVKANELQDKLDVYVGNTEKSYSYAGGIIGKVNALSAVEGCELQKSAGVKAEGSYLGGITEINEGVIKDSNAVSLGNSSKSRVGGIAGINKEGASIMNCTASDVTVSGRNMVGIIAAESYGKIIRCTVSGEIQGFGENIGGIAGIVYEGGTVSESTAEVSIQGSGTNVGGAVGTNLGEVSGITSQNTELQIQGSETVGGIIGLQLDSGNSISLKNAASVKAENGAAGGIFGILSGKASQLENSGSVEVPSGKRNSFSGGIAGVVNSEGSVNTAKTSAKSIEGESAGGAVGKSLGRLTKINTESSQVTGFKAAGGTAGLNESSGVITSCAVKGGNVSCKAEGAYIGGITGENSGILRSSTAEDMDITANKPGVYMGGAVGFNRGTLTGDGQREKGVKNVSLSLTGEKAEAYGNLGGVAGVNTGFISAYSFSGEISGASNNPAQPPRYNGNDSGILYGSGAVVGVNGLGGLKGEVSACGVMGAQVKGAGSSGNIANLGGAVGVNNSGSVIRGVEFTAKTTSVIAEGTAHSGGICGINMGEIHSIDGGDKSKSPSLEISAEKGFAGGIAGYNTGDGKIFDSTGNFAVSLKGSGSAGGIVGLNDYNGAVDKCVNNAAVIAKEAAAGGIIGVQKSSRQWTAKSCQNLGDITAKAAGGIIGQVYYRGGEISGCENLGEISGEKAAGIAATVYSLMPGDVLSFQSSVNKGSIKASSPKGILGEWGGSVSPDAALSVKDCTTTGGVDLFPRELENAETELENEESTDENQLASPKIKFRLKDPSSAENTYEIIVENYVDYKGTGAIIDIKHDYETVATMEINELGEYEPAYCKGFGLDTHIMSATAATDFGESPVTVGEVALPSDFASFLNAQKEGFFKGEKPGELLWSQQITNSGGTVYYKTELTGELAELGGIPVVLSGAVTKTRGEASEVNELLEIPKDLQEIKNLSVRTYPLYFGDELVKTQSVLGLYAKGQLVDLTVDEDGKEVPIITNLGLRPGYSLEKEDGKYRLCYNPLLKSVKSSADVTAGVKQLERPKIKAEINEESGIYTALWDTQGDTPKYGGAKYSFTLLGTTVSGDTVELQTVKNKEQNSITQDINGLPYTRLDLVVTRMGSADDSGRATAFGAQSEAQVRTKPKLSQISKPVAESRGTLSRSYRIAWDKTLSGSELPGLDYFEVTVKASDMDEDFNVKEAVALYSAGNESFLDIDLDSLETKDEKGNNVTFSALEDQAVRVSVRAVAKQQSGYASGKSSEEAELLVAGRLETPSVSGLESQLKDSSVESFKNNGFILRYSNTAEDYEHKDLVGRYQLAISVTAKDGSETLVKELYSQEAPLTMTGTRLFGTATAVLGTAQGLKPEYFGHNLKIQIRAVSDNLIASPWSQTVTLSMPVLTTRAVDLMGAKGAHGVDCIAYDASGNPLGEKVRAPQDSFTWQRDSLAGGYRLLLQRAEKNDPAVDCLNIVFKKGEKAPAVYFLNSKDENLTSVMGELVSPRVMTSGDNQIYLYELPGYSRRVVINGTPYNMHIQGALQAIITKNGDVSFTLVLPDGKWDSLKGVPGSVSQSEVFISAVSMQVLPLDGSRLAASEKSVISRTGAGGAFKNVIGENEPGLTYGKMESVYQALREKISARALGISDEITISRPRAPAIPMPTPKQTPNPSPSPTPKPSVTPKPTNTPEPDQTPEPSTTPEPTNTPKPTEIPSESPTPTPTGEPDVTPKPTESPKPTAEPTPVPTVEPTAAPTQEPTAEPTPKPTAEPTPEPTQEPEPTPTAKPEQPPGGDENGDAA